MEPHSGHRELDTFLASLQSRIVYVRCRADLGFVRSRRMRQRGGSCWRTGCRASRVCTTAYPRWVIGVRCERVLRTGSSKVAPLHTCALRLSSECCDAPS